MATRERRGVAANSMEAGTEASREERRVAGDPLPPECELIEVHVSELLQMFNAMDPSPFHERDLDPNAEEFILGWAREAPRDAPLGLLVTLDRAAGLEDEPAILRDSIAKHFTRRADSSLRRLRQLLRIGRTSLVIGLVFLAAATVLGDVIAGALEGRRLGVLLRESLMIGGWVAMWRPLEIFLYDWWPIRAEIRLFRRLCAMPVRIAYKQDADPGAWRRDWPAVPALPWVSPPLPERPAPSAAPAQSGPG
jgi:hypothetical protein